MALTELHGVNGEGKFAIVDEEDFEELSKFYWKVTHNGYVYREMRPYEGVRGPRTMYHHILDITDPDRKRPVDHKDRNKLNHRRSNLVRTTPSGNLKNRPVRSDCLSGVKHVSEVRKNRQGKIGTWYATTVPGLGNRTFNTLEEAATHVAQLTGGQ